MANYDNHNFYYKTSYFSSQLATFHALYSGKIQSRFILFIAFLLMDPLGLQGIYIVRAIEK